MGVHIKRVSFRKNVRALTPGTKKTLRNNEVSVQRSSTVFIENWIVTFKNLTSLTLSALSMNPNDSFIDETTPLKKKKTSMRQDLR